MLHSTPAGNAEMNTEQGFDEGFRQCELYGSSVYLKVDACKACRLSPKSQEQYCIFGSKPSVNKCANCNQGNTACLATIYVYIYIYIYVRMEVNMCMCTSMTYCQICMHENVEPWPHAHNQHAAKTTQLSLHICEYPRVT